MSNAWAAWKAATRLLFWQCVETLTAALRARKAAERELTAFNPAKPQELFDSRFAVFWFDMSFDLWQGVWRPPGPIDYSLMPQFECYDWRGVPWHRVTFKELPYDGREFRAVALRYAKAHLTKGQLRAAP